MSNKVFQNWTMNTTLFIIRFDYFYQMLSYVVFVCPHSVLSYRKLSWHYMHKQHYFIFLRIKETRMNIDVKYKKYALQTYLKYDWYLC